MIPIDIWIVEDDTGFRRALQRMLSNSEGITCDHVFPSCDPFFEAIKTESLPDLVLMDLGLPGMSGLEAIKKLSKTAPDLTVVVLTVSEDKEKVIESLNAGAAGYLLKTSTGPELVKGLRQVFFGNTALSPSVAKIVLEEMRKPAPSDDFNLTPREIEVIEKLAEGLSIKEIGVALEISYGTAAFHLANIYEKLQVQSQSGAVAKALRSGII